MLTGQRRRAIFRMAVTNACELRCEFCYASKLPGHLESNDIVSWAAELDKNGCLGIGFGGGEPTAYPGFAALCHQIHERTNLAITMTTHGHRFTPQLANSLVGSVSFIRLSMDGVDETYERIRGRSFIAFKYDLRSCARRRVLGSTTSLTRIQSAISPKRLTSPLIAAPASYCFYRRQIRRDTFASSRPSLPD